MNELLCSGEIHKIDLSHTYGSRQFNAGMVEVGDKTFLLFRAEGRNPAPYQEARLIFCELYPDFTIGVSQPINLLHRQEDTRMILWNNIIFVIFTDRRVMHQAFIDPTTMTSDPATLRYTAAVKCNYACATQKTEKNWAPFLIDNKLYAIYRHTPSFVVIKFNGTLWSTAYNVDAMSMFKHWQFGEIRGGIPPVWHNNKFYSFFHSSMHYTPKQRGIRQYYVGCYTFDQNFKILRLTHRPIMFGLPGRRIDCVFPCGAICKDNKWYISYGYQDAEVRVAVIDCYEIDQLLQYHETDII